jgi:hypothetical protein
MDLQLPDSESNGLKALRLWIKRTELDEKMLNFGIIATTSYPKEELEKAVGDFPKRFGNSFLGVVITQESLSANLERYIENSFFTPPFVRGGSKFYNTRLIRDKFQQFEDTLIINGRYLDKKLTLKLSDIFAIENRKEPKPHTNYEGFVLHHIELGELPIVNFVKHDGQPLQEKIFFRDYCYDPSKIGDKHEYHITYAIWDDKKEKELWLQEIRENAQVRILAYLNQNLPVFIHTDNNVVVNTLYLSGGVQRFVSDNESDWSHLERKPKPKGQIGLKRNGQFDAIPVNGRKGEKIGDLNVPTRINDAYTERKFALDALCSESWQPLLQQIRNYLGIK